MAVYPEAIPLEWAMVTSAAEECSAIEFGNSVRNRSEKEMNIAFFLPTGQCNSP
jgi:hypothetical protein